MYGFSGYKYEYVASCSMQNAFCTDDNMHY